MDYFIKRNFIKYCILELLICDVDQLKSKSVGYEKTMWERIGMELEKVDVKSLGFNHPICSRVLDIKSEPFTKMPGLFLAYQLKYTNTFHDIY
jgi:hypothetical protein